MQSKKINKYYMILIKIYITFIYFINITHANYQIIQIYSLYQSIDILTNTISFKTNVILQYKQCKINANKILITQDHNTHNILILKAFGNPVILNYTSKSGNIISAQSLIMYYDSINNLIKFTGNAKIEQAGNSIQSDDIIYSITKKRIQAISKENNKIITTLLIKPI